MIFFWSLLSDLRIVRVFLPAANAASSPVNKCDDMVPGEIIIQYKHEKLEPQSVRARGYLKQVSHYRKSKAASYFKNKLKNYTVKSFESALDIESSEDLYGKEVIQEKKALKRRAYIDEASIINNLNNIYMLKIENAPNPLLDWTKAKKASGDVNKPDCASMLNLIKELKKDPNVLLVEPNYKFSIQDLANDAAAAGEISDWNFDYNALWGLQRVKADQVWSKTQGQDVIVAVLDTGVDYNHPDLWENIWVNPGVMGDRNRDGRVDLSDADTNSNGIIEDKEILAGMIGYDFANNDNNTFDDRIGHGTHVSGIIAAKANNSKGIVGAAPRARILPVKIFDISGNTNEQILSKAILYAAKMGADVANMSITGSQYSQLIDKVFKTVSSDMVCIAAAGNSFKDVSGTTSSSLAYPANYAQVISVAATTEKDTKASFSNHGFTIDIAAPGGSSSGAPNILSSDRTLTRYKVRAGTSMATPYVSAVAALIKSQHASYTTEDVKNIIRASALKLDTGYNLGAGLLQMDKAMQMKSALPRAALTMTQYQYPALSQTSGIISIQGSITGAEIASYDIYIGTGTNPKTWDLIAHYDTTFMKKGLLHRAYDTHAKPNGVYVLRLAVKNTRGEIAYDDALIKIAN